MAIVGDFDAILHRLRGHYRKDRRLPVLLDTDFLEEVTDTAVRCRLRQEHAFESDRDGPLQRVEEAMGLMWRTLALWLAVLAVLVLAGWIS